MHFAGFHMEKRSRYKTDAELTSDVVYEVWRKGGNPDAVNVHDVSKLRHDEFIDFPDEIAGRIIERG
jgi:hypothetical protein